MKITITPKQMAQFNIMRATLKKIASNYQTPSQLQKSAEKQYGLDYSEALEMTYENIQTDAKYAVKGVKQLNSVKP